MLRKGKAEQAEMLGFGAGKSATRYHFGQECGEWNGRKSVQVETVQRTAFASFGTTNISPTGYKSPAYRHRLWNVEAVTLSVPYFTWHARDSRS